MHEYQRKRVLTFLDPDRRHRRAEEHPDPHARDEQQRRAAQQHHHRRAEVGLHHHQRDRRHDDHERRQGVEELLGPLARQPVVIARQHQDHRHLGDLRRLDLHRPQHQPTLGAHADLADHVDRDQQQHRDDVDRPGERQPDLGIDQRHHQAQAERHAVTHGVLAGPRIEAAAGRGIERDHADRGDRRQHQDQAPVDAPDLLAEADRRRGREAKRRQGHRAAIFLKRSVWREGSSFMVSSSTSRPIGPAVAPPAMPCSTITAQA
jgi:hypothetical protein